MRYLIAVLLFLPLQDDQVDEWIEQLGADDLQLREKAMEELGKLGKKARQQLYKALKSENKEIRSRARTLLDDIRPEFEKAKTLDSDERFAFSPTGDTLVCYRGDKMDAYSTKTWKSRFSAKLKKMRKGRRKWARSAPAFSPDGKRLFIQADGSGLEIFDMGTGKEWGEVDFEWNRRPGALQNLPLTVAPFGERSAFLSTPTASYLHLMKKSGGRIYEMPGAQQIVSNPGGTVMIGYGTLDGDAHIFTFQADTYRMTDEAAVKEREARLAAPRDVSRVYLGAETGIVSIHDSATLGQTLRKQVQKSRILGLSVRADGKWIVTCGSDNKVRIFEGDNLNLIGSVEVGEQPNYAVVSDDGRYLGIQAGSKTLIYRRK